MTFPEFGKIIHPTSPEVEKSESFPEFGKIKSQTLGKEELGDKVLRNILGRSTTGISAIAGGPGEVKESIEKLPGGIAKLLGADPEKADKATEISRQITRGIFGQKLPTGQELKKSSQELSKGYLAPQTPGEAFADEVTEFVAPIMTPFKGVGTLNKAKRLLKIATVGTASTALGRKIEKETGSHGKGQATKIGSYILMSLFNPRGMDKYISGLYSSARDMIKGDKPLLNTKNYVKNLTDLENEIKSSLSPSENQAKVLAKIDEIKKAAPGEINPNRILDTKKSVNDDLSALIHKSDRPGRKMLRSYIERISGITKGALQEYGEKNPEFWKLQESADRAFATKARSELVARNLEKALEGKNLPHLEKALPLGLHYLGKAIPAIGGIKAGAATPIYFMGRFAYRYAKSPELRRYYNNLLLGGMNDNPKLIRNSAEKIEKELAKESIK